MLPELVSRPGTIPVIAVEQALELEPASRRCLLEHGLLDGAGALGLGQDLAEGRDVVVPLDQRRDAAEARDRRAVQRPDPVGHGCVVRVEQVRAVVVWPARWICATRSTGMPARYSAASNPWFVALDEDVVHVEEEPAVGALGEPRRGTPTRSSSSA